MQNNCKPCTYTPPAKCYVCYPKVEEIKCDDITTEYKTALGGDERYKRWLSLFYNCYNRCPKNDAELKEYVLAQGDKFLGLKTGGNQMTCDSTGCYVDTPMKIENP